MTTTTTTSTTPTTTTTTTTTPSRPTPAAPRPESRLRRLLAGTSTPARLWQRGALLVLLCLVVTVLSVVSGTARTDAAGDSGARLATLDYDAAELYQALNGANASAATGLATDRTASPSALARYDSYITGAYLRLGHARSLVDPDEPDTALLESLGYELPRYTAQIDAARAVGDQDPALTQARLANATTLMRTTILPAADTLQSDRRDALASDYAEAGGFPVFPVAAGVVTFAALVAVSVVEARRTHRVLNPGLVAATVLVLTATVWWTAVAVSASAHLDTALAHNVTAADLSRVRITMLQARAVETDPVGNTGTASPAQTIAEDFTQVLGPGGELDTAGAPAGGDQVPAVDAVRAAVAGWQAALGDHGAGSEESRSSFVRLTTALGGAIAGEQGLRTAAIDATSATVTGLAFGPAVLAAVAAVSTGLGIRTRLREY